jgi:hypothetical protein
MYARVPVWYRSHSSEHLRCCDAAETPPVLPAGLPIRAWYVRSVQCRAHRNVA